MVGKKTMSLAVYEAMCMCFIKGGNDVFNFSHCFLTLEWNLMGRAENCVKAHVKHICWTDDALVLKFAKHKGDQTENNADKEWHVYANPHKPHICPILALAKYVFSNPGTLCSPYIDDGNKIFPGTRQYQGFMDSINRVVAVEAKDVTSALSRLGIFPGLLGSHSARKGACTHVSSRTTYSPPIVSVCLHACWTMGSVKDKYLHFERAGDQYCGRTATGMDPSTTYVGLSSLFTAYG